MDRTEATALLQEQLERLRTQSYQQLQGLIGDPWVAEIVGRSGARYQVEIEAFWDREPGGDLRVMGGIDDGGWHAFAPLTEDFIIRPDGTFVGE